MHRGLLHGAWRAGSFRRHTLAMNNRGWLSSRVVALCMAWVALMGCAAHAQGTAALRVGSKRFTESYILAQVLAQKATIANAPAPVVMQGLGNTAIVYEALRSGSIDLYPEYLGTISLEILKNPAVTSLADINRQLAPLGLGVAISLGFNDGYALAMREDEAARLGIAKLSDLASHGDLKLGLSNEFIGRADGWQGLAKAYGLPQSPTGIDHGLAYDALAARQIAATDIYTTDAKIGQLGLRVLQDDRHYFPRYDAVVLYKLDVPQRFPAQWAAMQGLAGSIDEAAMIAMNARAELNGVAFDVIARDHLRAASLATGTPRAQGAASGSATGGAALAQATSGAAPTDTIAPTMATGPTPDASARGFWAKLFGPDLPRLAGQHLVLVLLSVGIASLLGIPLSIAAFARPRLSAALLATAGLLQTIPSLAMLAALIPLLGAIGTVPALIALTLYSLLPIMRNTVTGLAGVPQGLALAGQALGMTAGQRMRGILLPLALPVIIAGVRTATSIAIGTATIAAFIGAGGFGERIVTGLALNDGQLMLAGAVPAALLALLSEGVFALVERSLGREKP
jgi:osmoprotectant transport system permease protein